MIVEIDEQIFIPDLTTLTCIHLVVLAWYIHVAIKFILIALIYQKTEVV